MITKMFLANTSQPGGQQVLIAQSPGETQGQTFKFLSSSPSISMGSPTKTITYAQAQQMGLIPGGTNKVQHILPSGTPKPTVNE